MDKIMDVHVTLPEKTAREVNRVAKARNLKRSHLLRMAVDQFLERIAREERESQMRAYVEAMAPYSDEFVRETEVEVERQLLENTEW